MAKVSLRSVGDEDTTPISEVMLEREREGSEGQHASFERECLIGIPLSLNQEFGGGGHKNASSFVIPKAVLEGWKV